VPEPACFPIGEEDIASLPEVTVLIAIFDPNFAENWLTQMA
jgi:hypothetical protein